MANRSGALAFAPLALAFGCSNVSQGTPNNQNTKSDNAAGPSCAATRVEPLTDPDSGLTCHASACTPAFCSRGDIAPLQRVTETGPLVERLAVLDCSPHSVPPLQVFA